MRPHRFVLISALVAALAMPDPAAARPRLLGIVGAVAGVIGGLALGHRAFARHRYYARHYPHPRRYARHAPSERRTEPSQPRVAANASARAAWAGQMFWPGLSDDLFDYILWPSGNADRFWTHGLADITDGIFRGGRRLPEAAARRKLQTTAAATDEASAAALPQCPGPESADADALVDRIEHAVAPTDAQKSALDALRSAFARALDYINTACPSDQTSTPLTRLDSMEDRLWAGRQALLTLRAPLDSFYKSLTDEQKARLNGPLGQNEDTGVPICQQQENPDWPGTQIDRRLRPAPQQRPALEAVRTTLLGMSRLLSNSCPAATPSTPLDRLDAADKWLNTLLYAVVTVRAPLDGFYSSLTEAQKVRFATLKR
jgi:hypothetical protein